MGFGILTIWAALISSGFAQDVKEPNILLKLTEPARPTLPNDIVTRDDLRDVPPPPADKLSEAIHTHVVVGDPRCLPGEDWFDPGPVRNRTRRPGRSR